MTLEQIRMLKERRAKLIHDQRALFDAAEAEQRAMTPEELDASEKMQLDIASLQRQTEGAEQLRSQLEDLAGSTEPRQTGQGPPKLELSAFHRFAASGLHALTTEERRTMNAGTQGLSNVDPDSPLARDLAALGVSAGDPGSIPMIELRCPTRRQMAEERALATGTANLGEELIPEGFWPTLTQARDKFGGIRRTRATILETTTGNPISIPTADDTGNVAVLVAEGGDASAQADPATGEKALGSYKFSTKVVRVSLEMLQDSAFQIEPWLASLFGERIGRGVSPYLVTGTGSSQPEGAVTNAATVAAAAAGAIALDDFLNLEHGVNEVYRLSGEYVMNDTTGLAVRKLKDADGNYKLQASDVPGRPDRIGKYGVTYDNSMAAIGADAKSVLFGDLSAFWIRDVLTLQMFRLNEMFIQNGQVGFLGFVRHDSVYVNAGTDPFKVLEHPSS